MTEPWDVPKQVPCDMCDSRLFIDGIKQPVTGPCSQCNGTKLMPAPGPDDWSSTREDPVTDEMLNFLDTNCENQRIRSEKHGLRHGFYPYPYLEMKRLIYEIRALRGHKQQPNND